MLSLKQEKRICFKSRYKLKLLGIKTVNLKLLTLKHHVLLIFKSISGGTRANLEDIVLNEIN